MGMRTRNREARGRGAAFMPLKMKRLLLGSALMVSMLSPSPSTVILADVHPASREAVGVRIIDGPRVERATRNLTIISWTSNTPEGSLEHFGVVRYGTDPDDLRGTARSHIRLNPGHSSTVFRVRIVGLKPRTMYYYQVDSMEPNGTSDRVQNPVHRFTTSP